LTLDEYAQKLCITKFSIRDALQKIKKIKYKEYKNNKRPPSSRVGVQKQKKHNIMFFQNQTCLVFVGENKKIQKKIENSKTMCNNRVFESLITMVVCNNPEFGCLVHRGYISIRVFYFLGVTMVVEFGTQS
jgi:transcription initiation factor IIE alpha subunit